MKKQKISGGTLGIIIGLVLVLAISAAGYFVLSQNRWHEPVVKENSVNKDIPAEVIDYEQGIKIKKPSDTDKLKGASDSFKEFIANDLEIYEKDFKLPGCSIVISVMKLYNDEFALGRVQQCDSASDHVWKKEDNGWSKVLAGTIGTPKWSCAGVNLYKIPSALIPECME